ncbi:MAG: lysophospholipid acyltransferase family protein, partial [Pseudomonadota bacterium]
MKKLFKKFYKNIYFRKVICSLIANYIRFVYYTSRKVFLIEESAKPYVSGDKQAVIAFWHGRLLMMPMIKPRNRKMNVLISTPRDGEIISLAMNNFGFGTIRGSSTRGGGSAAIKTVKALQSGENVSITPDGPKGPAMKVQIGIVTIAEMAKLPIVYSTYSCSKYIKIKSWDSFIVALPFSKIYYKIGIIPINSTKEELEEQARKVDAQWAD